MPKSGKYYVNEAEKHGLKVEMGRGDHCKIYGSADRGYCVVPLHRELASGTECHIKKWFKMLGILVVFALLTCACLCLYA